MTMFSDFLENNLVDFLLRGQAIVPLGINLYVGLFTSDPVETGAAGEVVGGNYGRAAIVRTLAAWSGTQGAGTTTPSTGTSGTSTNNAGIAFPIPNANWTPVTQIGWWGIFDSAVGGNLLLHGALGQPKSVNNGDPAPVFNPNFLSLQMDN